MFLDMVSSPTFWMAAGQIVLIDILLGGDNAILIGMACRNLPPQQRRIGILWGTAGAIVLRIVLILFAIKLLALPYLKLTGGLLLLWIGVKLMLDESDAHGEVKGSNKLLSAIWTIVVADLVMSIDNVLGIASAAHNAEPEHQTFLIIFGLLVSIPLIVWGSQLVIKLMTKYPIIITLGAMLLGWLAGSMISTDPALVGWFEENLVRANTLTAVLGSVMVLLSGLWMKKRQKKRQAAGAPH